MPFHPRGRGSTLALFIAALHCLKCEPPADDCSSMAPAGRPLVLPGPRQGSVRYSAAGYEFSPEAVWMFASRVGDEVHVVDEARNEVTMEVPVLQASELRRVRLGLDRQALACADPGVIGWRLFRHGRGEHPLPVLRVAPGAPLSATWDPSRDGYVRSDGLFFSQLGSDRLSPSLTAGSEGVWAQGNAPFIVLQLDLTSRRHGPFRLEVASSGPAVLEAFGRYVASPSEAPLSTWEGARFEATIPVDARFLRLVASHDLVDPRVEPLFEDFDREALGSEFTRLVHAGQGFTVADASHRGGDGLEVPASAGRVLLLPNAAPAGIEVGGPRQDNLSFTFTHGTGVGGDGGFALRVRSSSLAPGARSGYMFFVDGGRHTVPFASGAHVGVARVEGGVVQVLASDLDRPALAAWWATHGPSATRAGFRRYGMELTGSRITLLASEANGLLPNPLLSVEDATRQEGYVVLETNRASWIDDLIVQPRGSAPASVRVRLLDGPPEPFTMLPAMVATRRVRRYAHANGELFDRFGDGQRASSALDGTLANADGILSDPRASGGDDARLVDYVPGRPTNLGRLPLNTFRCPTINLASDPPVEDAALPSLDACAAPPPDAPSEGGFDAAEDRPDASRDVAPDSDVPRDAAVDVAEDAPMDSGTDVPSAMDARTDLASPMDVGTDLVSPADTPPADTPDVPAPVDAPPADVTVTPTCPQLTGVVACTPGAPGCDVEEVTLGRSFSCARLTDGSVRCWGLGTTGVLGNGATMTCARPGLVLATGFSQIGASFDAICGQRGAAVDCWGSNSSGQLALGATTPATVALPTRGLAPPGALTGGGSSLCALTPTGEVSCWGANASGELGDGTTTMRSAPVPVGLSGVRQLDSGTQHSCAVTADTGVSCWGSNAYSQLGVSDATLRQSLTPRRVAGLGGVAEVACGNIHTCVRTLAGNVLCWGNNSNSELGNGTTTRSPSPVVATGLDRVVEVGACISGTCARRDDGTLWCWGDHQVTGAGTAGRAGVPAAVAGLTGLRRLWSGPSGFCVLGAGVAELWCWGTQYNGAGIPPASFTRPARVLW